MNTPRYIIVVRNTVDGSEFYSAHNNLLAPATWQQVVSYWHDNYLSRRVSRDHVYGVVPA